MSLKVSTTNLIIDTILNEPLTRLSRSSIEASLDRPSSKVSTFADMSPNEQKKYRRRHPGSRFNPGQTKPKKHKRKLQRTRPQRNKAVHRPLRVTPTGL